MAETVAQNVDDEELMRALAYPTLFAPVLEKLQISSSSTRNVMEALKQVEQEHPGFHLAFVRNLMIMAGLENKQPELSEAFLRLEAHLSSDEFLVRKNDPLYFEINERSLMLTKKLGRIPDEISDRKKFLEVIKDIAGAIRDFLQSMTDIRPSLPSERSRVCLDQHKKEFVRQSKNFSQQLKLFFRVNKKEPVYISALVLVLQTQQLIAFLKTAS